MGVAAMNQCYQRSGIDQNHLLRPLRSIARNFFPVCSERSEGPPETLPIRWAQASAGREGWEASCSLASERNAVRMISDFDVAFCLASRRRSRSVSGSHRRVAIIVILSVYIQDRIASQMFSGRQARSPLLMRLLAGRAWEKFARKGSRTCFAPPFLCFGRLPSDFEGSRSCWSALG